MVVGQIGIVTETGRMGLRRVLGLFTLRVGRGASLATVGLSAEERKIQICKETTVCAYSQRYICVHLI